MAHLTHKIDWSVLVDYYSPYEDHGISLPTGECGRIHLIDKKTIMKVENRRYLEDKVCHDEDCTTNGTKLYRKNMKRKAIFTRCSNQEELKERFLENLRSVIGEFAAQELLIERNCEYQPENFSHNELTDCNECNNFITLLEFGDKKRLFEYSNTELQAFLGCAHGGQAVGNCLEFLFHHVLQFYLFTNLILYTNLDPGKWPKNMKANSYFWNSILHACDGQTFPPHCRKYLYTYMNDFTETRELCKRLFKFMYLYVMVCMKVGRDWTSLFYIFGVY